MKIGKWRLSRRGAIRALSFLCAAFAVMGGFIASGYSRADAYKAYIEQDYQHSFFELSDRMSMIDAALQKGLYASSAPMVTLLAAEISKEASAAQGALGKLPFRLDELERTSKFLSQSGDFAATLARTAGAGIALTAEQRGQLRELSEAAGSLAQKLTELQSIINEENLRVGEIIRAEEELESSAVGDYSFASAFKEIEAVFPEVPSLIYDGPFSEHMFRREPVLLKAKAAVSADEAGEIARAALGLDAGILRLSHDVGGTVPRYCFQGNVDGGELSAEVTKQGGVLYSVLSSRSSGQARLRPDEGVKAAGAFLSALGFDGMRESYWSTSGNFLLVNFAYEQDGALCYPDLVKVGVALDTGKVVQVDAAGYVMNHPGRRGIPAAKVSPQDAEAALSPELQHEKTRLCVIPSPGGGDVACYELACRASDGQRVMVYVNVETGAEERILMLIEDESGTLTY